MEILGIGPMELALVVLLALILIGPREMGKSARAAGRFLNRLYRSEEWTALQQASRNLRNLPARLAREAELEELEGRPPEPRREPPLLSSPVAPPDSEPGFAWRRPSHRDSQPPEPAPGDRPPDDPAA